MLYGPRMSSRPISLLVLFSVACGSEGVPADLDLDVDVGRAAVAAKRPLEKVHFLGRFDTSDGAGPRFAWPGTAIATRFVGTGISVALDESGANQFEVTLDGVARPVLKTTSGPATYVLASGLGKGTHDLVIARRTESFFGITRFLGFSGARLVATRAPSRRIEFVGDSITCGYGVLGVGPGCSFSADTEAETHAWGEFAARELGAAHTAIAYSGRGVIRNFGDDPSDKMPLLFERTFADDPSSVWDFSTTPRVVVVNLGTNDFWNGDPGVAFRDGYIDFVAQIRAHYPRAWILLATSPMLGGATHEIHRGYLDEVVAASDERVRLVDIAEQDPADGLGCDFHPSEATQAKMAAALVPTIREVTGW